jgi:uncharacterized membrane protein YbaN (DUF454 family)
VARAGWFAGGWCAVAVGSVGVIVPGLPTTVFFIIAAWCFGKSSPRFEAWVLDLPRIGPMVRDHREGLGMPRRAKVWAIGVMWVAIGSSALVLRGHLWIVLVVVALGAVGTAYILWRVPTKERVLARRAEVSADVA